MNEGLLKQTKIIYFIFRKHLHSNNTIADVRLMKKVEEPEQRISLCNKLMSEIFNGVFDTNLLRGANLQSYGMCND